MREAESGNFLIICKRICEPICQHCSVTVAEVEPRHMQLCAIQCLISITILGLPVELDAFAVAALDPATPGRPKALGVRISSNPNASSSNPVKYISVQQITIFDPSPSFIKIPLTMLSPSLVPCCIMVSRIF
jgi:hypothetical protein